MSIWSSGAKAVMGAIGKAADETIDLGIRAGARATKMAGGVARAATVTENAAPGVLKSTSKAGKFLQGSGDISNTRKAMYGVAAGAGLATGVAQGVLGTARDAASMSGLSGDFLAQHSLRRVYGQRDSRPNQHDENLGDLTLNLGNSSVLNRSIKR